IDPDELCFNVEVEEHSLGDLNKPANYKAAVSDPEFEKWLVAMNMALNNAQTKTNSLAFRSMLEKHQLTGPNFNELFRTLKLVVRTEKLQNVFETALPPAPAPAAGADA
nr:retrotransposon protein, putative [Tanacetum cinerariifolium]